MPPVRRPVGWTGGQYSLYRHLFGVYLFIHFSALLPWGTELFSNAGLLPQAKLSPLTAIFPNLLNWADSPFVVLLLLITALVLSLIFAAGWKDRWSAIGLWYLWACLYGRNPLIGNPSLPFIGWLLLAHALIPDAPYGAWAVRGRPDPEGGWRMPPELHRAAWIVMSLAYSYSGWTKLASQSWRDGSALSWVMHNPLSRPVTADLAMAVTPSSVMQIMTWGGLALELLFAPLALSRRLRPWLWLAMTGMHFSLLLLIDFADLTVGMLILHLFTFNPAWVAPVKPLSENLTLYYDGDCGLCHRFVRFVLAEDGVGAIRFSPLFGAEFNRRVMAPARDLLPDTVVVQTAEGVLLTRTAAIRTVLARLGGLWRLIGIALAIVPGRIADWLYDQVAVVRGRLFAKPKAACPLIPAALRSRFIFE